MRRSITILAASTIALGSLAACSSSSGGGSSTASPSTSQSSSSDSGGGATCSKESITAALPSGTTLEKYDCADVAGTEWAAAKATEGGTVFFLKKVNDSWSVSTSDAVCGAASAGLPQEILAYCENASPSPASS